MTYGYTDFPIESIKTLPSINTDEVSFIINDFRFINESDSLILNSDDDSKIDSPLFFEGRNQALKENQDFGRKLFNPIKVDNSYYTKTQKWLGHVIELNDDKFTAVLKDLTSGGTEEIGEFYFDEITPDDHPLISKGAAFYMSLGFISDKGTRRRESEIRFQRLADFDQNDINNKGLDTITEFINYF